MKKSIVTIGLFTLALVSTSFATQKNSIAKNTANTINTPIDGNGGQSTGDNRKVDYNINGMITQSTIILADIDGNGGQSTGDNRKRD